MAKDSIVDQYIDSLFVFEFSDAPAPELIVSTIDSDRSLVPTFQSPVHLGQFMLMAHQLLVLACQMPESRLKQSCLNAGASALNHGRQSHTTNLTELMKLNTLVR